MTPRRPGPITAPDWPAMIDDMLATGLTLAEIGDRMCAGLSGKLLKHYRAGGQPVYWRGDMLIAAWCGTVGKPESELPRAPVVTPRRVDHNRRGAKIPPEVVHVPWPPVPASVMRR